MSPGSEWFDGAAGRLVRPYALTGGRTKPAREGFDLITIIMTADASSMASVDLGPEHAAILRLACTPQSVAEIGAKLSLPLAVLRVLLGDLFTPGWIIVRQPTPMTQAPDERVLKDVIDGLKTL
jgi:hypothetical protein